MQKELNSNSNRYLPEFRGGKIRRSGLERPHFSPLARGEKSAGVAPAHTFSEKRVSGRGGNGYAAINPEELRASREVRILRPRDLRHMRNRTRCGFALRDTTNRKCTALVNVGVMLVGLPFSGQAARGNTKPAANAEPQRHDSSRSIGRILAWKKLSIFNQKQRTCRRKKCLSRTWVLRDLENRSF